MKVNPNSKVHRHAALQKKPFNPSAGQAYEGKVIAVNPVDTTVDIRLFNGQILRSVKVLFNSANTVAGFRYLASIENSNPSTNSKGILDDGRLTHIADTLATILYVQGETMAPRVIGFSFPKDAQMHVDEPGLALFRHESGIYSLIDQNGHHEIHYPDGSYIIAGPENSPKEMESSGQQWQVPAKPNINLTLHLAQGFDLNITGGVLTIAGGTEGVARVGDTVSVNVGGQAYTGTITSGSKKVLSG